MRKLCCVLLMLLMVGCAPTTAEPPTAPEPEPTVAPSKSAKPRPTVGPPKPAPITETPTPKPTPTVATQPKKPTVAPKPKPKETAAAAPTTRAPKPQKKTVAAKPKPKKTTAQSSAKPKKKTVEKATQKPAPKKKTVAQKPKPTVGKPAPKPKKTVASKSKPKKTAKPAPKSKPTQAPKPRLTVVVNIAGGQREIDQCRGPVLFSDFLIAEHDYCGGQRYKKLVPGDIVRVTGSKVVSGLYAVDHTQMGRVGQPIDYPKSYAMQTSMGGGRVKLWHLRPLDPQRSNLNLPKPPSVQASAHQHPPHE